MDRRVGSGSTLRREVAAWSKHRNEATTGVEWQFTTADASTPLRQLCSKFKA